MATAKPKAEMSPERRASLSAREFLEKMVDVLRDRRVKALHAEHLTYRAYREGPSIFTVVNFTKCSVYTVDIAVPACNCQDFTMNGGDQLHVPCKHMLFVAHVLDAQAVKPKKKK